MGDFESSSLGEVESPLKYRPKLDEPEETQIRMVRPMMADELPRRMCIRWWAGRVS